MNTSLTSSPLVSLIGLAGLLVLGLGTAVHLRRRARREPARSDVVRGKRRLRDLSFASLVGAGALTLIGAFLIGRSQPQSGNALLSSTAARHASEIAAAARRLTTADLDPLLPPARSLAATGSASTPVTSGGS